MAMTQTYEGTEPSRSDIDAKSGPLVLEFGTPWCGYCKAAQGLIQQAYEQHPAVPHIKIEDGSGRRLGRSFGIKLWPSLIFLKDGKEMSRLVRPTDAETIQRSLAEIDQ